MNGITLSVNLMLVTFSLPRFVSKLRKGAQVFYVTWWKHKWEKWEIYPRIVTESQAPVLFRNQIFVEKFQATLTHTEHHIHTHTQKK